MTTNRSEDALYSSLVQVEALEQIVKIGLPSECIPTPPMRDVVAWSISYFEKSGQSKAPTREALMETWGQVIEDAEVEIEEVDVELEEVGWAIDALKAKYADWRFQSWQKEAAAALSESNTTTRLSVLETQVHELNQIVLSLRDKTQEVEGMDGFARALAAYERRAERAQQHRGLAFGIEPIDEYTYGIHEGELAVLAAGPKTGKSVVLAYILLQEWKRGRHVTLNTLENSVDMTYDRLVCIHLHVDHDRWRKGQCSPDEVERVQTFIHEKLDDMKELIHVIQPQRGQRTVEHMTRHARAIGTQSLLLDQLTFMEASDRRLEGPRKITDIMHDLKDAIGGRLPIPCLLAHQINREGMREAKKNGWLEMYMLAEGSEVERTSDWVFGLYASPDERQAQMIKIQTLATRRGSTNMNWRAGVWRPWVNQIDALEEITEPQG